MFPGILVGAVQPGCCYFLFLRARIPGCISYPLIDGLSAQACCLALSSTSPTEQQVIHVACNSSLI